MLHWCGVRFVLSGKVCLARMDGGLSFLAACHCASFLLVLTLVRVCQFCSFRIVESCDFSFQRTFFIDLHVFELTVCCAPCLYSVILF